MNKIVRMFIVLVVTLLFVCLIKFSMRHPYFPPGPKGFPLIGNLLMLLTNNLPAHVKFQNLAKVYGPVVGFYVGPIQPVIVVSGFEAVKEVLLNDHLTSRPNSNVAKSRSFGHNLGFLFNDGEKWHTQRKFTLRHLREFGFGKNSLEDQIMEEVHDLMNEIEKVAKTNPQGTIQFSSVYFSLSVINVLWVIIGGKRFHRDDTAFVNLLYNVDLFLKSTNQLIVLLPVPSYFVRRFPSVPKLFGADTQLLDPVKILIQEAIDEHLTTACSGDAPRDFLDVYLKEMEKREQMDYPSSFTNQQLVVAVEDLFAAGADTSASAIAFAILYMVHHSDVQHRMQAELDDVCGDSFPSLKHRSRLPYTEAVSMELLRVACITPTTIPHVAFQDTTIQGYHIPRGSIVAVNLASAMKDETKWKDPLAFNPVRHLSDDGKIIKNEAFIPFGMGKRVCLGEPLARNTFFLFLATLFKTFEFKAVPDEPLPTLEPVCGIISGPKPFKAIVLSR